MTSINTITYKPSIVSRRNAILEDNTANAPNTQSGGKAASSQQTTRSGSIPSTPEEKSMHFLSKGDFALMSIVGQFNSGFIVCKLIQNSSCILAIVDQHAADERFNLERLARERTVIAQKLISPIFLQLVPEDKIILPLYLERLSHLKFDIFQDDACSDFYLSSIPSDLADLSFAVDGIAVCLHQISWRFLEGLKLARAVYFPVENCMNTTRLRPAEAAS